jgi:hypothetical protein
VDFSEKLILWLREVLGYQSKEWWILCKQNMLMYHPKVEKEMQLGELAACSCLCTFVQHPWEVISLLWVQVDDVAFNIIAAWFIVI